MHAQRRPCLMAAQYSLKTMLAGVLVRCWCMCCCWLAAPHPSSRMKLSVQTPGYAKPPATEGVLAAMANNIFTEHGPEHSGFKLLDGSLDALQWRLALIDSAVSSVDIQTYLWYPGQCRQINTGACRAGSPARCAGAHDRR